VARGCCTNFMAIKYGKKKLYTTFSPFTGVNPSQRRVWALKPHASCLSYCEALLPTLSFESYLYLHIC